MNVGKTQNEKEITENDLSNAYTQEFLDCCRRHGIKLVSIHTRTRLIKGCAENPFTAFGNVFADEREGAGPQFGALLTKWESLLVAVTEDSIKLRQKQS